MASASPNVAQLFAVGTSLGAYPQSNWREHELPPSGAPKGAATATASVAANGAAAFTNLAADTRYFATDATGTRYVSFSTFANVPPAQRVTDSDLEHYPAIAAPGGSPEATSSTTAGAANRMLGARVVIPRTGTLGALYVPVNTTSGNLQGGIYDVGATTSAVRTRLWAGASTASASGWLNLGNPALAVTKGQHLDFVVQVDNNTVTVGRRTFGTTAWSQLPTGAAAVAGVEYKLGWFRDPGSYALSATLAEADANPAVAQVIVLVATIA